MLDPVEALLDSGFHHVVVLDGTECGLEAEQSLILALWCYEAEKQPASDGAWIHPYYFASQKAYTAAASLVKSGAFPALALRDEIRVKPILRVCRIFAGNKHHLLHSRHRQPLPCTDSDVHAASARDGASSVGE